MRSMTGACLLVFSVRSQCLSGSEFTKSCVDETLNKTNAELINVLGHLKSRFTLTRIKYNHSLAFDRDKALVF